MQHLKLYEVDIFLTILSLSLSVLPDRGSGTLVIRNATDQSDGTYQCSVSNLVGHEKCELILSPAATGDSKAGVIVGAVLGALLALLLLLLLLWLLCCCCRRRRHKKDRPYDIREDAAPPVSREPSVRSVRSYKAHQARKAMDPAVYSAMKRDDSLQIPTPEHSPFSRRIPSAPPGESKPFFHI
ncbi:coxsackievirus and adenovirus receptor homolog [Scyliorhinus canicula]|uniref:coxsackievirus and adenovirus receptor homolog n=1 Tax=Scyliorhinus canicula TaxID=7830 RepID=UPI0018F78B0B|nr:coxsackievirus and adenovirus receptor homolog [Scyliorhinus canicula]